MAEQKNNRNQKQNRKSNVVQMRRGFHINIGMIIFFAVLLYIIVMVIQYFTSDTISGYEVREGSLAVSNTYKAFALRDETVVYSDTAGYVNYYIQEDERVGVGNLIYSIDEGNSLAELLASQSIDESNLSTEELRAVKNQLIQYQKNLKDTDFSRIYAIQEDVEGTILKYANYTLLENVNILNSDSLSDLIHFGYSQLSGIVTYHVDGFEDITLADLNASLFDYNSYQKDIFYNNDLVEANEPIYKVCTDENWYLVIPLTEKDASELQEETNLNVRFLDTQYTTWAEFSIDYSLDGIYGILKFTNSMLQYAQDRYVDIEIITEEETGLKIPLSSIVEKEFYLIPEAYVTKGGKNSKDGVMRLTYDEKGNSTSEFVEATLYSLVDGEYYIDQNSLRIGDIIIQPDSTENYTITKSGTLIGVYNMNKGYADFREISILYQNDEYAIVQPNTTYGLTVYDYIVLDAATVNEDDFIY